MPALDTTEVAAWLDAYQRLNLPASLLSQRSVWYQAGRNGLIHDDPVRCTTNDAAIHDPHELSASYLDVLHATPCMCVNDTERSAAPLALSSAFDTVRLLNIAASLGDQPDWVGAATVDRLTPALCRRWVRLRRHNVGGPAVADACRTLLQAPGEHAAMWRATPDGDGHMSYWVTLGADMSPDMPMRVDGTWTSAVVRAGTRMPGSIDELDVATYQFGVARRRRWAQQYVATAPGAVIDLLEALHPSRVQRLDATLDAAQAALLLELGWSNSDPALTAATVLAFS